jgi:hypothetical protein
MLMERDTNECSRIEDINGWSENSVLGFLMRENLSRMIRICSGMKGTELLNLHRMCQSSPVVMYRELKSELAKVHDEVLPVAMYLRFISRLHRMHSDTGSSQSFISGDVTDKYG